MDMDNVTISPSHCTTNNFQLESMHTANSGEVTGNDCDTKLTIRHIKASAAVHGVAESRTRLSDFTSTFHFHALEKEMAAHSSVLAWRIPGTGEPGGLLSMGSHRVGHD